MFFFDILIYVFFALIMFCFAKQSMQLPRKNNYRIDGYLWMYILFFTIISAIRWRVGIDSESYIETFETGYIKENSEEFLWDSLVSFVKENELHFTVGTGIAAFLQIFFLTESLKKYKYVLVWMPVVLFGGRYYLDLMNGVRQMIVACGFVLLSRYIVGRNIIKYGLKYFIGVALLSGIHRSALILLPFYFFAYVPFEKLKLPNHRFVCLAILFGCFILGITPAFQNLIGLIELTLLLIGYENLGNFYNEMLSGETSERLSMGPIMISFLVSSAIYIWYAPKLYNNYGKKIKLFNLWYSLSLIFSCGFFLVCNISHMMIRPLQYFEFFQVIMLSLLLDFFYANKARYRHQFYILTIVIWTCTMVGVYKASEQVSETTTYKTFFNHI